MKRTHKGFTLVELLIVIAIIGVLATMMTLTVKDQTPKAQAARIISDFKMLRTAAALYNYDSSDVGGTVKYFNEKASPDYLGGKLKNYTIDSSDGYWKAKYTVQLSTAAKTALTDDAGDLGLTISTDNSVSGRIF